MVITKQHLRILRYIYRKKSVYYSRLSKKVKDPNLTDILDSLVYNHYVIQVGGKQNVYGEPIPIEDTTLFQLDLLGIAEVENSQWFNGQFVLLQIVLPVIIAVITTLITIFLTTLLSPSL